VLCPLANRPANGPAADSRLFAPVKVGDPMTAEGNFETVGGVRFLSAHSSMVQSGLTTKLDLGQPDYMFLDEVEIDMPAWQNERIRTLIIGYTTANPADVLIWSLHYDPQTNQAHEFPLASTLGCDVAAGAGSCARLSFNVAAGDIFKIRHDLDFGVGADAKLNPCAHLQADPGQRFGTGICPNTLQDSATATPEMLGILSPTPHEIQGRTGKKVASLRPGGTLLTTLDISGNEATNGQYLFPFGMNLGGLATVEPNEFDLNAVAMPFYFSALPWAMDRRLSPAGCIDTTGDGIPDCEATPQPLDPFPFEASDPRLQAAIPVGSLPAPPVGDGIFTATTLTDSRNRMFSFVNPLRTRTGVPGIPETASGNFDGDSTLLVWPPVDPAAIAITPVTPVALVCADTGGTGGGALLSVVRAGNGLGTTSPVPWGGSVPFDLNAVVILTAKADDGSIFGGWVGAGCTDTGPCVVTLTASTSVTAVFTKQQFSLTVAAAGTGTGTVSPVAAGSTASVDVGTPVTLTATADAGSGFIGWSGGGCPVTPNPSCTVTLTASTTVTATFDTGNFKAVLLSPTPASTFTGPSATFTWSPGSGATEYILFVGTATGRNNLVSRSLGLGLSTTVNNLPVDGSTIFVRLLTRIGGILQFNDYTFTAATFTKAALISPTQSPLVGPSVDFTWSAGSPATGYIIWVGTAAGRNNLVSRAVGLNQTTTVNNLPVDGSTIFVRLFTNTGTGLTFIDYTFTTGP